MINVKYLNKYLVKNQQINLITLFLPFIEILKRSKINSKNVIVNIYLFGYLY